ncbi:hypothetical protein EJ03DRAFT_149091 [Teratosphaeria nubilosa]|uniref:Uncharacterized protein n=1 Tax=Teratosphaeria nubilosa TaxID=161662 RepID=A0A6G1L447_9PEZI|nr:hypothetical protein EJ03DRAFT_149091 [Teratosphaeria nubilosa]
MNHQVRRRWLRGRRLHSARPQARLVMVSVVASGAAQATRLWSSAWQRCSSASSSLTRRLSISFSVRSARSSRSLTRRLSLLSRSVAFCCVSSAFSCCAAGSCLRASCSRCCCLALRFFRSCLRNPPVAITQ